MNNTELIKHFLSLESNIFGPPNYPGVYGVYVTPYRPKQSYLLNKCCKYIGSSKNVYKRIMNPNHIYRILLRKHRGSDYLVWTTTWDTTDYLELEKELIRLIKPEYNIIGKRTSVRDLVELPDKTKVTMNLKGIK